MKYQLLKCDLAALIISAGLLISSSVNTPAQEQGGPPVQQTAVKQSGATQQTETVRTGYRRSTNAARKRARPASTETKSVAAPPTTANSSAPVVVLNDAPPDYLTGEASVQVNPKQPKVIKVALAQNMTCVVELPASDFIYYTHEGNPQLVAIFDSPTKETDHFITLMPGTGFIVPPPGGKAPMATITLQMQSGLVLPILIVPVADPMNNAHRVVINYNRDEVVAARRAAGLAVNLDGKERTEARPRALSTRIGKTDGDETDGGGNTTVNSLRLEADVESARADGKRSKKGKKPADPVVASNQALASAVKSSSKVFSKWTAASHGLSLALSPAVDLDEHTRLLLIAVRNESQSDLRLVPGNPDLYVQWYDEKGSPLNITQIKRLHVETTSVGGRIPAGQTVFYAICYETPITGALQKVRVSVAQITASDQPVAADLESR